MSAAPSQHPHGEAPLVSELQRIARHDSSRGSGLPNAVSTPSPSSLLSGLTVKQIAERFSKGPAVAPEQRRISEATRNTEGPPNSDGRIGPLEASPAPFLQRISISQLQQQQQQHPLSLVSAENANVHASNTARVPSSKTTGPDSETQRKSTRAASQTVERTAHEADGAESTRVTEYGELQVSPQRHQQQQRRRQPLERSASSPSRTLMSTSLAGAKSPGHPSQRPALQPRNLNDLAWDGSEAQENSKSNKSPKHGQKSRSEAAKRVGANNGNNGYALTPSRLLDFERSSLRHRTEKERRRERKRAEEEEKLELLHQQQQRQIQEELMRGSRIRDSNSENVDPLIQDTFRKKKVKRKVSSSTGGIAMRSPGGTASDVPLSASTLLARGSRERVAAASPTTTVPAQPLPPTTGDVTSAGFYSSLTPPSYIYAGSATDLPYSFTGQSLPSPSALQMTQMTTASLAAEQATRKYVEQLEQELQFMRERYAEVCDLVNTNSESRWAQRLFDDEHDARIAIMQAEQQLFCRAQSMFAARLRRQVVSTQLACERLREELSRREMEAGKARKQAAALESELQTEISARRTAESTHARLLREKETEVECERETVKELQRKLQLANAAPIVTSQERTDASNALVSSPANTTTTSATEDQLQAVMTANRSEEKLFREQVAAQLEAMTKKLQEMQQQEHVQPSAVDAAVSSPPLRTQITDSSAASTSVSVKPSSSSSGMVGSSSTTTALQAPKLAATEESPSSSLEAGAEVKPSAALEPPGSSTASTVDADLMRAKESLARVVERGSQSIGHLAKLWDLCGAHFDQMEKYAADEMSVCRSIHSRNQETAWQDALRSKELELAECRERITTLQQDLAKLELEHETRQNTTVTSSIPLAAPNLLPAGASPTSHPVRAADAIVPVSSAMRTQSRRAAQVAATNAQHRHAPQEVAHAYWKYAEPLIPRGFVSTPHKGVPLQSIKQLRMSARALGVKGAVYTLQGRAASQHQSGEGAQPAVKTVQTTATVAAVAGSSSDKKDSATEKEKPSLPNTSPSPKPQLTVKKGPVDLREGNADSDTSSTYYTSYSSEDDDTDSVNSRGDDHDKNDAVSSPSAPPTPQRPTVVGPRPTPVGGTSAPDSRKPEDLSSEPGQRPPLSSAASSVGKVAPMVRRFTAIASDSSSSETSSTSSDEKMKKGRGKMTSADTKPVKKKELSGPAKGDGAAQSGPATIKKAAGAARDAHKTKEEYSESENDERSKCAAPAATKGTQNVPPAKDEKVVAVKRIALPALDSLGAAMKSSKPSSGKTPKKSGAHSNTKKAAESDDDDDDDVSLSLDVTLTSSDDRDHGDDASSEELSTSMPFKKTAAMTSKETPVSKKKTATAPAPAVRKLALPTPSTAPINAVESKPKEKPVHVRRSSFDEEGSSGSSSESERGDAPATAKQPSKRPPLTTSNKTHQTMDSARTSFSSNAPLSVSHDDHHAGSASRKTSLEPTDLSSNTNTGRRRTLPNF